MGTILASRRHPTEVAAVLADPTRFAIYQYLDDNRLRSYTVQDIAQQFNLHPNVARTHLAKLEEVNLVEAYLEKTGRGGRPGKRYMASDRPVALQFPSRDYELLANMALDVVDELGETALAALERAAYRRGLHQGHQLQANAPETPANGNAQALNGHPLIFSRSVEAFAEAGREAGLIEEVWPNGNGGLTLRFTNCPFREVAAGRRDPVCRMHQAMLRGLLESYFGPAELIGHSNIVQGERTCEYTVKLGQGTARS